MRPIYLGIDLGGSNISAALMTTKGEMLTLRKTETQAQQGYHKVLQKIIALAIRLQIQAQQQSQKILAIGMGVPGVLDLKNGLVRYSPNLPGWKNVPLQSDIKKALKKDVVIDNDANVAALGEQLFGAGKNYQHVVVFTLGTGVGGGIILDGKIFHGFQDGAGELGHTTILPDGPRCSCGNYGCLEALASGAAIARQGKEFLAGGQASRMLDLCGGTPEQLTAKMVFTAARQNDPPAQAIVRQAGIYLGLAVANIINLLNPERVIIGGGVSAAGELLFKYVRQEAKRRALKVLSRPVKIVRAKLSDRAGVYGAVGIAIQAYPNTPRR